MEQGIRFIEKAIGADAAVLRHDRDDDTLDVDVESLFGLNGNENVSVKEEKTRVRMKLEKFDLKKKTSSQLFEDILAESEAEKSRKRKREKPDDEKLEQIKRLADIKGKEKVLKRLKTQLCDGTSFILLNSFPLLIF